MLVYLIEHCRSEFNVEVTVCDGCVHSKVHRALVPDFGIQQCVLHLRRRRVVGGVFSTQAGMLAHK